MKKIYLKNAYNYTKEVIEFDETAVKLDEDGNKIKGFTVKKNNIYTLSTFDSLLNYVMRRFELDEEIDFDKISFDKISHEIVNQIRYDYAKEVEELTIDENFIYELREYLEDYV